MKFVWEESDFKQSNRKNTGYPVRNESNELTMLGWQQHPNSLHSHYCVISLRDGMVIDIGELEFAVQWLNKYNYAPVIDVIDLEKLTKDRKQ